MTGSKRREWEWDGVIYHKLLDENYCSHSHSCLHIAKRRGWDGMIYNIL